MIKTMQLISILSVLFFVACNNGQNQKKESIQETAQAEQSTAPEAGTEAVDPYADLNLEDWKAQLESSDDAIVLDVRTPEEVVEGVIPGAEVINIHDEDFKEQVGQLDKQKPAYVYCKMGGRSSRAVGIMKELGFEEAHSLDGGITAWKEAGYETEQP